MKKSKFLIFGLCSILLLTGSLAGCANGTESSSSDSTTTTPAPATTPAGGSGSGSGSGNGGGSNGGSASANQTAINNAAEGASITLSGSDTNLQITRAITVNGNNLSGATITVSPSVARNVTLRNFRNSNIRVANVPNTNSSINTVNNGVFASVRSAFGGIFRSDGGNSQGGSGTTDNMFKKLGEDAVPLHLENCTIGNFEAEGKVALYLEKGANKKSEITEIKLKAGAEDFSFIEFDENGKEVADKTATPTTDKSKVGNLKIEDNGVSKVNLIGGTFDNVSFGSGVTSGIELKYDKEFNDQLNFSGKETLLADTNKITAKEDVAIAKNTGATNGVYKIEMSPSVFTSLNGFFSIIFMKDNQKEALTSTTSNGGWMGVPLECKDYADVQPVATMAEPMYAMIPAGNFTVENPSQTGTRTIYGSEYCFLDYSNSQTRGGEIDYSTDVVLLTKYRNYNKESVLVKVESDKVTIYVDTSKIKKNDVLSCAHQPQGSQKQEVGTKLSEFNLTGYKPYLAIDWASLLQYLQQSGMTGTLEERYNNVHGEGKLPTPATNTIFQVPSFNSVKFAWGMPYSTVYSMTSGATYPDIPDNYEYVTVTKTVSNPWLPTPTPAP